MKRLEVADACFMADCMTSTYAKDFLKSLQKEIFHAMLLGVHGELVLFDDEDLANSFWEFAAERAESFGVFGIRFLCYATSISDKAKEEVYTFLFNIVQVLGRYETDRRCGDMTFQKEIIEEWREKAGDLPRQCAIDDIVLSISELEKSTRPTRNNRRMERESRRLAKAVCHRRHSIKYFRT